MFLKYLDFLFAPFRKAQNQYLGYKNQVGNVKVDINRSKAMVNQGKGMVNSAGQKVGAIQGQAGMQQQGAAEGMPNPNPPIRTQGFWIFKKKICTQCEQNLDRTWDGCPFCAQMAAQAAAAPAKLQAVKTQAIQIDVQGNAGTGQLLGWIVPLQGVQRGELFTLSAVTTIGTDATCTIVLNDKFMSGRHAEIKAENGIWVLKDAGSTNGTYVNNKRIDKHELVDNDFIKFGSALIKFKQL